MDSIIAHLAVAGVPEPMPFIVQLLAHKRAVSRRAAPKIVVNRRRHRCRRTDLANAFSRAVNQCMRKTDWTEIAAVQIVKSSAQESTGTVLGSHLDHALILPGRGNHLLPFPKVVRKRLLDINVLAGLTSPNGSQRVPVILQGDHHRINGLIVEHASKIRLGSHLLSETLVGFSIT